MSPPSRSWIENVNIEHEGRGKKQEKKSIFTTLTARRERIGVRKESAYLQSSKKGQPRRKKEERITKQKKIDTEKQRERTRNPTSRDKASLMQKEKEAQEEKYATKVL